MPDQQFVETLRIALTARQVADRKTAIARTLEAAQQPGMREAVKGLLMGVVTSDMDMGVRELAKEALRKLEQKEGNDDARHMVGVKCPAGHVIYIDRRRLCGSDGTQVRMRSGDAEIVVLRTRSGNQDLVVVKCPDCGKDTEAKIDCQGYA